MVGEKDKRERKKGCINGMCRKHLEEGGEEVKEILQNYVNTIKKHSQHAVAVHQRVEGSRPCICINFHGNTTIENNTGI